MGDNMPGSNTPAQQWLEARIAAWAAGPAAIGLTSAQVTNLAADITDARDSFTSVQTIRGDSRNATASYDDKATAMRHNASPLIANIKNFAENQADPQVVYDAANVSPKDPPSPAPAPSQPTNIRRVIEPDGAVTLSWDAIAPVGAIYNVTRRLATETGFTFVGQGDGSDKSFSDSTVPPGTTSATYIIQGVRGSKTGPQSQPIVVFFGTADAETGGAEVGMGLAA